MSNIMGEIVLKIAKKGLAGLALAVPLVAFAAQTASAKPTCVDVLGQIYYFAKLPKNDKPKVIPGKIVDSELPFVASGMVNSSGDAVIHFTENYPWSLGGYINPASSTVITFPAGGGAPTFDLTYHGDGNPPNDSNGSATVVTCP